VKFVGKVPECRRGAKTKEENARLTTLALLEQEEPTRRLRNTTEFFMTWVRMKKVPQQNYVKVNNLVNWALFRGRKDTSVAPEKKKRIRASGVWSLPRANPSTLTLHCLSP